MARLRITEIFYSIQGESRTVGWPTVFVRLTGCPLRCHYCDTAYAFTGGQYMAIDEVVQKVSEYPAHFVTVTGGEPLAQPSCHELLGRLCDAGYEVSLETSGALDIRDVDPRVIKVMDIKTPKSGEMARNYWPNIEALGIRDQVKFVICDRQDFDWACMKLDEYRLHERCEVLFSPNYGQLPPENLAQWILDAGLSVRMQIQLHKIIWGDEPGR
ncbi:MAG: 7-carboxy-7-deazaguanine synthase QueE [Gammaproteobacteria bacterium]|nr:MAG: 7-carboxy-7-deazaguanine synthase QueE [Gammaproteobacteria bacterium]